MKHKPDAQSLMDPLIGDGEEHPDRQLWRVLFGLAHDVDWELVGALRYLRGLGTTLVRDGATLKFRATGLARQLVLTEMEILQPWRDHVVLLLERTAARVPA